MGVVFAAAALPLGVLRSRARALDLEMRCFTARKAVQGIRDVICGVLSNADDWRAFQKRTSRCPVLDGTSHVDARLTGSSRIADRQVTSYAVRLCKVLLDSNLLSCKVRVSSFYFGELECVLSSRCWPDGLLVVTNRPSENQPETGLDSRSRSAGSGAQSWPTPCFSYSTGGIIGFHKVLCHRSRPPSCHHIISQHSERAVH